MYQVQPEELPRLSCFILRDRGEVDGDFVAEPHFLVTLTLGISGAIVLTDDEASLQVLEQQTSLVKPLLFNNYKFTQMFEGIQSYDRKLKFTQVGETMIAEYDIELEIRYRRRWQPVIPDWLEDIHIESRYPSPGVDPTATPQVVAEWDIPIGETISVQFNGGGSLAADAA